MTERIEVVKEECGWPGESCVFCRQPTNFWVKMPKKLMGNSPACCKHCAETHNARDLPTKDQWCERERLLAPTGGKYAPLEDWQKKALEAGWMPPVRIPLPKKEN